MMPIFLTGFSLSYLSLDNIFNGPLRQFLKNYISLNDNFQAVFILESIIENFNNYPNLVSESKSLLDAIGENKLDNVVNSNKENNE